MAEMYYGLRTDFAHEMINKKQSQQGFQVQRSNRNGLERYHVTVDQAKNSLNKPVGEYFSLQFDGLEDQTKRTQIIKAIGDDLNTLLDIHNIDYGSKVLVIGLGNRNIIADALGPMVCQEVMVTNHIIEHTDIQVPNGTSRVAVVAPGVMGETGLETSHIVQAIQKTFKADVIIVIDALASLSIARINRIVQISDTGISPGSGLGNHRIGITEDVMKAPVIAVGVATVVEAASIVNETIDLLEQEENMVLSNENGTRKTVVQDLLEGRGVNFVVTPKEIDETVVHLSQVIAQGINRALHEHFEKL